MYKSRIVLVLSAIVVLLAAAGIAQALSVSDAMIAPAVISPGDYLTISVRVDDPEHRVAKVIASSAEFTRIYDVHVTRRLNDAGRGADKQAGDGVWTAQMFIPAAPSGKYHFEIILYDAQGVPLTVTTGARMPAERSYNAFGRPYTIKDPPAVAVATVRLDNHGSFSSPQLRAAAAPWRPQAQMRRLSARPVAPGQSFRFVAMGDSCYHADVFLGFLRQVATMHPDFIVDIGDIVDGEDDPWDWPKMLVHLRHVAAPFFVVMGNHDIWPWQAPPGSKESPQGRLFEELFGASDYYFDYGGFRFVAVETARFSISPQRLKWLDRVLDTPLRKIVMMHVPPSVITKWADFGPGNTWSDGAPEFADLAAAHHVERVYIGHLHRLDVATYKGVRYVMTGATGQGAPGRYLRKESRHLILVEAGPGPLREIIYRQDGSHFVLDPDKWESGEQR